MKNINTELLVQKIAGYQDLLAAGAPAWERDRDTRCRREISAASSELVAVMVAEYRAGLAKAHKLCENL